MLRTMKQHAAGLCFATLLGASPIAATTVTNAVVDPSSVPPTVTYRSLDDDPFADVPGEIFQIVDGVPTELTIVTWQEDLVTAELASAVPGDYLTMILQEEEWEDCEEWDDECEEPEDWDEFEEDVLLFTLTVPAADADGDDTNELNTGMSLSGTVLEVTDAGGTVSTDLVELMASADTDETNELNTGLSLSGTILEVTDAGGTQTTDLASLLDDADSDPANEVNTSVALIGTTLSVTDAGGTQSTDLASLVNDADADPANEVNASVTLVGTTLSVTDAGGAKSTDLASLVDDADSDPANEHNTSLTLVGTTLSVTDAGGTHSADLAGLVADGDSSSVNELNTGVSLSGTTLSVTDAGGTKSADLANLDGASFTNLNGSNVTTGTVAEPRIADSIARDSEVAALIAAAVAGAVAGERDCPGSVGSGMRYSDCGNGTVRDNNTGLIWLKDASCAELVGTDAEGRANWSTAQSAAAALASGTCGLTDGSVAGEWRQPTNLELCSAGQSGIYCPVENASTSLVDSSVGPPTVVNAAGNGVWTEGDPFVGVQSAVYWAGTAADAFVSWGVRLDNGLLAFDSNHNSNYIWPVRNSR